MRPSSAVDGRGFFGDWDAGMEGFEAPAVGYDADRSYDALYTGTA